MSKWAAGCSRSNGESVMIRWGVSSQTFRLAALAFGKLCLIACAGALVIALTIFQQSLYIDGKPNYRLGLGAICTTFLVSFAATALRMLEAQFTISSVQITPSPPTTATLGVNPPPPSTPIQKET